MASESTKLIFHAADIDPEGRPLEQRPSTALAVINIGALANICYDSRHFFFKKNTLMAIRFNSERDRALHPQGRLVNSFLMEDYFHNQLTTTQAEILSGQLSPIEIGELLSGSGDREKLRLLLCYFCSKQEQSSLDALPSELSQYASPEFITKAGALTGYFTIIKQLDIAPESIKSVFKCKGIYASLLSNESGDSFIEYLTFEISPTEKTKDIFKPADFHRFYRLACKNGHLAVIRHLEAIGGFDKKDAARANNYDAYRSACANGHLAVIRHLEAIDGFDKKDAATAGGYWLACMCGHLAVIEHLEAIDGFDKKDAATADDCGVYRVACQFGYLAVIEHLLNVSNVFSYAERHDGEYGEYTHPFITKRLVSLRERKETFERDNPNGVFDLDDANEAELCFYMLRNLIRRGQEVDNQEALLNNIRFLLSIPVVRSLVHQSVNQGQENELVRLAIRIGNGEAATLLMQIPEVRALAEQHDFYRREAEGDLDLSALARDRESSMTSLSVAEKRQLEKVTQRYQSRINELGGIDAVFEQFKSVLKKRYEATPEVLISKNRFGREHTIKLPFEWNDLQALKEGRDDSVGLNDKQYQQALKAYYQHEAHTACRYLSKPNYWMAADASYVYVYKEAGRQTNYRYSTFEEYINLIAPFYLAVSDEGSEPVDGYSLESRMAAFIKQLALIGRAHNWDNSKVVIEDAQVKYDPNNNPVTEEYDDLKGDKPSCYSGVKRRLFQSVLGHKLFKLLTDTVVRQALNENVRAHYNSVITGENAKKIKPAYDALVSYDFDSITEQEADETLKSINIPEEVQARIIDDVLVQIVEKFEVDIGEVRDSFSSLLARAFSLASGTAHLVSFDGGCGLSGLLDKKCQSAQNTCAHQMSTHGMFTPNSTPNEEDKDGPEFTPLSSL